MRVDYLQSVLRLARLQVFLFKNKTTESTQPHYSYHSLSLDSFLFSSPDGRGDFKFPMTVLLNHERTKAARERPRARVLFQCPVAFVMYFEISEDSFFPQNIKEVPKNNNLLLCEMW